MQYATASIIIAFVGLASAAPTPAPKNVFSIPRAMLRGREVPQEHSHDRFLDGVRVNLNIDNPDKIGDPVFGLLGNAAAAAGAGSITNLDCLHQATADRAFTNAKAANNVTGMADALMYAALERNTGGVGTASVLCTDKAVNAEIQSIAAHQDPASTGAAATNKAIVLNLAKQLASVGADAQEALLSGTFAPGETTDNTGKGNTCDTLNDAQGGCIFSQNLLVEDATAAEITAAIAGVASSGSTASNGTANAGNAVATTPCASVTASATKAATKATSAAASKASSASGAASTGAASSSTTATGTNVQTFTGTLGGTPPPVVSSAGDRPFSVNGNTFVNSGAALQRSCAIQNNACANDINNNGASGSVSDCNAQETACNAAASA